MRPTAFVAGPYIDTRPEFITKNIEDAKTAAVWLWDHGYYVFCPHMNTAGFHVLTSQGEDVFKAFYLRVIRSGLIDLIVLLPYWKTSEGTMEEFAFARNLQIPVFEFYHEPDRIVRLF